jgi:phosphatidate cytidylyltransferase
VATGVISLGVLTGLKRRTDDVILTLGLAYITLPIIAVMWLSGRVDHGTMLLFWVLGIVWATDIGAYLAGNLLGGPKLAPSVSPSKTWSGLLGGLVAAVGLMVAVGGLGFAPMNLRFIMLTALVSLVAQGGDLLESMLKRRFEVKDSGTLIPGHGGVLDRMDSLLTAIPFVAGLQLLMGNGETLWR